MSSSETEEAITFESEADQADSFPSEESDKAEAEANENPLEFDDPSEYRVIDETVSDPVSGDTDETDTGDDVPEDSFVEKASEALGMTAEELDGTPPSVLEKMIERLGDTPASEIKDEVEATDDSESEAAGWAPDYDVESVDPDVAKAISQMTEHHNAEMAEVRGELKSVLLERANEAFDRSIEGLGKEWHPLFGKGSQSELSPGGKQMAAREKLKVEMDRLTLGYKAMKQVPPSQDELFKKAVNSGFGDSFEKIEKSKINEQVRKRKGGFTSRPTSRQPKPPTAEERATQVLADGMVKLGMLDEHGGEL